MLYISCIFQLNKKGPQYVDVLTVGLVKMYIYISRELKSALHVHSDIFKRFPVTWMKTMGSLGPNVENI